MSEIPKIYNDFLEIIDKEPEDNVFAKLAKYDLKYRIASYVLKKHDTYLSDVFKSVFTAISNTDKRYFEELAIDFINILLEKNKIEEALEFIRENELEKKIPLGLIADKIGLEGIKYLDKLSEKTRNRIYAEIWVNEARKGNVSDAFEKIKEIRDLDIRINGLLKLAEIIIDKEDEKEILSRIIRIVESDLSKPESFDDYYASWLIRVKCKNGDKCLDYFNKVKEKINVINYELFLPSLAIVLVRENNYDLLDQLIQEYIDKIRNERIYLEIVKELSEHGLVKESFRYILRIKDPILIAQAYLILIESTEREKSSEIINYSKLAITNLIRWFDNNFALLRDMAEKVKQEDKNYENMSLYQIFFYHPQISAYFRNIMTIFFNSLKSIVDTLIKKNLLQEAIHIVNYVCAMKRLGCELRDSLMFEKALLDGNTQKAAEILKNASTASLIDLVDRARRIDNKELLIEIIKEALTHYVEKNKIEEINGILPLALDLELFDDVLGAANSIKDDKTRIELKLMIANKLIDIDNKEKVEEIINEAKEYIEKHNLEESSNIARLLAPILFKEERYEETIQLVKKYLDAKDKWLAGLIISSIFKKFSVVA